MQINSPATAPGGPDLPLARARFGLLLGSVYRKWRRQVDLSFKDLGLSDATRLPLLALYVHEQPLRQKDLADTMSLDSSSLVRVLAQLREAALVDWSSDPADRRTKCISLTPHGRQVAGLILAKSLEIEQTMLAGLNEQQLAVTRQTLSLISQRFDELER